MAIIGQTGSLAPADSRFYATRDISATVESVPLITASILAKKLAAGVEALVMDVKTGSGAFMPTLEDSEQLARAIVSVARGAGCRTTALLTDMNQVLASSAGNSLEVREVVAFLTGKYRNPRLLEVTLALGAEMLTTANLARDSKEARLKLQSVLDNGTAADIFGRMVVEQNGPVDFVEKSDRYLPRSPVSKAVYAWKSGYVTAMDTRTLGMAVVALGGGRSRASDTIDYRVGLSDMIQIGDWVDGERALAVVHAACGSTWQTAAVMVASAITLGETPPALTPLVYRTIS